jgi:HSP20 family protein
MTEMKVKAKKNKGEVSPTEAIRSARFTPRVDILAREDEVVVYADVPGVVVGDVDIRFEKGELTIHGRCAPRQGEVHYLVREYEVGDFYRVFSVSDEIDASKITAELTDGVLTLHLPRAAAGMPRKIPVRGG